MPVQNEAAPVWARRASLCDTTLAQHSHHIAAAQLRSATTTCQKASAGDSAELFQQTLQESRNSNRASSLHRVPPHLAGNPWDQPPYAHPTPAPASLAAPTPPYTDSPHPEVAGQHCPAHTSQSASRSSTPEGTWPSLTGIVPVPQADRGMPPICLECSRKPGRTQSRAAVSQGRGIVAGCLVLKLPEPHLCSSEVRSAAAGR